MTPYEMVREFHATYGHPLPDGVKVFQKPENFDLRLNLLLEEASEWTEACARRDLIEQADALGDIVYVAVGAMLCHGAGEQYNEWWYGGTETTSNFTQEIIKYGREVHKTIPVENKNNTYNVIESLINIIRCAYVEARKLNIDLNDILEEVHASNMSKLGENGKPILRKDGKVLKGPNFFEPNIAKVIAHSRYKKFFDEQDSAVQQYLALFDFDQQK